MSARTEIIYPALRLIGAMASGETPSAADAQDALTALNSMLDQWSSERLNIWALTKGVSHTLVAGTASYTIGTAGTIATGRPFAVASAFVRDSGDNDSPLDSMSRDEYNNLALKSISGQPDKFYYHPAYPNGTIYLYPAPDAADTLYMDLWQAFTQFSSLDSSVVLPPGYVSALKFNLAADLAPEYGRSVDQVVAARADEGKALIKRANAYPADPVGMDAGLTGRADWRAYNILAG